MAPHLQPWHKNDIFYGVLSKAENIINRILQVLAWRLQVN